MEEKKSHAGTNSNCLLLIGSNFLHILEMYGYGMVDPKNKEHEEHKIIVNARSVIWKEEYIKYNEVVEVAFPNIRTDNDMFTVKV